MIRKHLLSVALCAGLVCAFCVPGDAAALAKACWSKPAALPKAQCICLEHEFQKVLSPAEMRIEILAFRGKYGKYRKKIKNMGKGKAKSFERRVYNVIHGKVCNR